MSLGTIFHHLFSWFKSTFLKPARSSISNTVEGNSDPVEGGGDNRGWIEGYVNVDSRQNMLDLISAIDQAGYKHRYSALQNASFIIQRLIAEHELYEGDEDLYSFIGRRCQELESSSDNVRLEFGLVRDMCERVKREGAPEESVKSVVSLREEELKRIDAEVVYPVRADGSPDKEFLSEIASKLIHTKLPHVSGPESRPVSRKVEPQVEREDKSAKSFLEDYHQFAYLTEERFHVLYSLLKVIVQCKRDGLTREEIFAHIDTAYRREMRRTPSGVRTLSGEHEPKERKSAEEKTGISAYTDEEHKIINVVSMLERKYITGNLKHISRLKKVLTNKAIDIIDDYKNIKEHIDEKTYFRMKVTNLKNNDPKYTQEYSCILSIATRVFEGKDEEEVFTYATRRYFQNVYEWLAFENKAPKLKEPEQLQPRLIAGGSTDSSENTYKDLTIEELDSLARELLLKYGTISKIVADNVFKHLADKYGKKNAKDIVRQCKALRQSKFDERFNIIVDQHANQTMELYIELNRIKQIEGSIDKGRPLTNKNIENIAKHLLKQKGSIRAIKSPEHFKELSVKYGKKGAIDIINKCKELKAAQRLKETEDLEQ